MTCLCTVQINYNQLFANGSVQIHQKVMFGKPLSLSDTETVLLLYHSGDTLMTDQVCQDAILNTQKTSFLEDNFELIPQITLLVKLLQQVMHVQVKLMVTLLM
jgi:hypothetical protein